jgi:hypothetical protein
MNKNIKVKRDTRQFVNQAWVRNGDSIVTGEALILACLLHTHGSGRNSDDMKVVQSLMNDVNLQED